MEPDRLDPPEQLWPVTLLLTYRVAELRRGLRLSVADVLWRLGLHRLAGVVYRAAAAADRDAHRIAHRVRRYYAGVPEVVHEETIAAMTARVLGRRP